MDALRFNPTPAADVVYPKGSIVVCYHCGKPLYRLQQSIYEGEPAARSAWKYAPVSVADLMTLLDRSDLEPGQRAAIKAMTPEDWQAHCQQIPEIKPGDFADCPACKGQFVYARTYGQDDGAKGFGDKGYVIQLAIIPPQGQSRRTLH